MISNIISLFVIIAIVKCQGMPSTTQFWRFRYTNSDKHYISSNPNGRSDGSTIDYTFGLAFTSSATGLVPVYSCEKSDDVYYTLSQSKLNDLIKAKPSYVSTGIVCWVYPDASGEVSLQMYGLTTLTGRHLMSPDQNEAAVSGFQLGELLGGWLGCDYGCKSCVSSNRFSCLSCITSFVLVSSSCQSSASTGILPFLTLSDFSLSLLNRLLLFTINPELPKVFDWLQLMPGKQWNLPKLQLRLCSF